MAEHPIIASRSDLLSLLTEACELEHGLACSYLYSAFSLKQDLSEGGLTWQQLQLVRKWAAQIFFVASQEMLHLAQAWNLLTAIGGTPYYFRPNFPQNSKYYPIHLPLKLEPFGRSALLRFIHYEHPENLQPDSDFSLEHGLLASGDLTLPPDDFRTVGELYRLILSGFLTIPQKELFIADPARQIGPEIADFPNLIRVVDRESAKAAIEQITEQGEGTPTDRQDSHYGMFIRVLQQYEEEVRESTKQGAVFAPVRDCIENPMARVRGDYGAARGSLIEDRYTQQVAELFDAIYILMLRMLAYVFSNSTGDFVLLTALSKRAIALMPTVIKPLAEALTLLPAGVAYGTRTAGAAFGMSRHVTLPPDPQSAIVLVRERIHELILLADGLAADPRAPSQLVKASANLKHLQVSESARIA